MPLPTLLCLAFASGVAASIAARSELRVSPRPSLLTRSFGAFVLFVVLTLVPISVYFYAFHGDWFLLYLVDVRHVPSAVALAGFLVEGLVAAGGFAIGAVFVRGQRETAAGVLAGTAVVASVGAAFLARTRLEQVGSYAQFHGGFGLSPYGSGALLQGTILMSVLFVLGLGYLLWRVTTGARRT
jgi:hypothetical protein